MRSEHAQKDAAVAFVTLPAPKLITEAVHGCGLQ